MENKYPDIQEEPQMVSEPSAINYQPFTPAQREIINAVAHLKDDQVRELQQAISQYFARKADEAMEELWDDGTWNEETLDTLRKTHFRTPYNQ